MNNSNYYYDILNIEPNSSIETIKKAYRQLSLKYHPDKNPNSSSQFNNINIAYNYLLNHSLPSTNTNVLNNIPTNNQNNQNNIPNNNGTCAIYDTTNGYKEYMNDIEKNVYISYIQAYKGCKVPITIERIIIMNGILKRESENIYIDIFEGIDNDEIIILYKKGNIVNNNFTDIKLKIYLNPSADFERDGLNIIHKKNITFKESLTGFEFIFSHINEKKYKILNNDGEIIYNGYEKNISNLGFKRENIAGNLIIKFVVTYPDKLSDNTIKQLKEIL